MSTSLTINASAAAVLAMYHLVGEERGVPGTVLTGTTQNDILKEYTAQNEFISPAASVDLVVDTMEWSAEVMPRFNPVNMRLPPARGRSDGHRGGSTDAQRRALPQRAAERGRP